MGTLRVEVKDSGAGLSEEEQKTMFGEFKQFNKNKLQGGGDDKMIAMVISMNRRNRICCNNRRLRVRFVDFQTHNSHAQGLEEGAFLLR